MASEKGADQARVACALACAIHVVGADLGDCLAAYQVAVALNPRNAALKLNLSQLLFIRRDDQEANKQLQDALRMGLDDGALLEAKFYQTRAHRGRAGAIVEDVTDLLARGVRLTWNVLANIDRVRTEEAQKADLLEIIRKVMIDELPPAVLSKVLSSWPAGQKR